MLVTAVPNASISPRTIELGPESMGGLCRGIRTNNMPPSDTVNDVLWHRSTALNNLTVGVPLGHNCLGFVPDMYYCPLPRALVFSYPRFWK